MENLQELVTDWKIAPKETIIIESYAPDVSSSSVREALRNKVEGKGILTSVAKYSDHHWLYVSLA